MIDIKETINEIESWLNATDGIETEIELLQNLPPFIAIVHAVELLKEQQAEIERLKDELNQYHKADTFLAVHGWQWKKTTTESSTNPKDGEQE